MRIDEDIRNWARLEPGRLAVEQGDQRITFGHLVSQAEDLAAVLGRAGIDAGDPVWLLLPNGLEFLVGLLAVLRLDAVVVPVNPRLTNRELERLAEACPPAAVMVPWHAWRGSGQQPSLGIMPRVILHVEAGRSEVQSVPAAADVSRTIRTQQGLPGVIFFTSGSTGRPKVVLLTHLNITSAALSAAGAFDLRASDRTLVCMQMCHSFTFTKQMLCHLGLGATLVLAPDFFQAAVVLEMIERRSCTTICAVPSMYVMLLEQIRRASMRLPTLRMLVSGGAPVPEATQIGLADALPHAEFISSYGLSEASPFVSWLPGKWTRSKVGSVGLPAPGVEILVVDEEGHPCPDTVVGEVCIRGPNVMAGYLHDPQATAKVLRHGVLHTGDMGWLDAEGCLYLCGRQDDMVLRGAENVYPAEVENILCNYPGVAQAAVVGVPHRVLGHDLVAFVVPGSQVSVSSDDLRRHCQESLAAFKVPRYYHVVPALPMTLNGKILRRELRDRLLAQRSVAAAALTEEERLI